MLSRTIGGIPVAIIVAAALAAASVLAVAVVARPATPSFKPPPGAFCATSSPPAGAVQAAPSQFVLASIATIEAHTAHVTIRADALGFGVMGKGAIDFQADAVQTTFSVNGEAVGDFTESIQVGGYDYELDGRSLADGWRRLVPTFGPLAQQLEVPDPTKLLAVMEKSPAGVRTFGTERVDGVDTTHYCADVPDKEYYGVNLAGEIAVDAWIGEGKVLQIAVDDEGMRYTEDFTDFGAPVHITAPATYRVGI